MRNLLGHLWTGWARPVLPLAAVVTAVGVLGTDAQARITVVFAAAILAVVGAWRVGEVVAFGCAVPAVVHRVGMFRGYGALEPVLVSAGFVLQAVAAALLLTGGARATLPALTPAAEVLHLAVMLLPILLAMQCMRYAFGRGRPAFPAEENVPRGPVAKEVGAP